MDAYIHHLIEIRDYHREEAFVVKDAQASLNHILWTDILTDLIEKYYGTKRTKRISHN